MLSIKKCLNVINKIYGPRSRYHKNVFLKSFLLYPCDQRHFHEVDIFLWYPVLFFCYQFINKIEFAVFLAEFCSWLSYSPF